MTKINIYVIHFKKLIKRKEHIDNMFVTLNEIVENKDNLTVNIITDHDPDNLGPTSVNIDKIHNPDKIDSFFNNLIKPLTTNNISNTMKHIKALEYISKNNNNNEVHIVIEDDVLHSKQQLTTLFNNINDILDKNTGVIFFGLPHTNIPDDKKHTMFLTSTSTSIPTSTNTQIDNIHFFPSCDSYMITPECAKVLIQNMAVIKFETNIQLSYIISKHASEICSNKLYPNIFVDGSKVVSPFTSSINPNNNLIFDNNYKELYGILNKKELTVDDKKLIAKILCNKTIMEDTDFQYLYGLYKMKIDKFKEAEKVFEEVYEQYRNNSTPINNTSLFLKNYVNLYRHIDV